MSNEKSSFNEWALVELFGHQKIVGKVSEATLAGGAFLRVDVPAFNGEAAFTRFYGPGAIYSINPVTEDIARGLMAHYRNAPVHRFELPQIAEKVNEPEPPRAAENYCGDCGQEHLHCICDDQDLGADGYNGDGM
jgi:hypothetical protein